MSSSAEPLAAMRDFVVDRNSPVPLYFQVSQHLERAIAEGHIPNGTMFDNEIALAEQFGLSRPTMRRAMQYLVDQGLVVRRRGIGTRVVQPKVRRPLELTSLYDDLAGTGQAPTTSVLELEKEPANDETAARLHLPPGEPVLRVVRLRTAKGDPIAKMTNYLPKIVGELDADELQGRGLYQILRGRGIQLHSATQTVGARNATAAEAKLLGEARNAALLTMQRLTYDDRGHAIEYGTHLYVASRYSFEIDLLAP